MAKRKKRRGRESIYVHPVFPFAYLQVKHQATASKTMNRRKAHVQKAQI
jgi:hypothetical protein